MPPSDIGFPAFIISLLLENINTLLFKGKTIEGRICGGEMTCHPLWHRQRAQERPMRRGRGGCTLCNGFHKMFLLRANRARVNQQQRQGHLSQNPHQGTRSTCSCRAFINQTINHIFPTGNPNVNHSGPPSTGKPVEGFVIMLKPHENAVCRPLFFTLLISRYLRCAS